MKKKSGLQTGFTVKENRGVVCYTQNYDGGFIISTAKVQGGDTFNVELGKAIAYAKGELMVRQMDTAKARKAKEIIGKVVKEHVYDDSYRVLSKHMQTACEYYRTLKMYRDNQKKMLDLISSGNVLGKTYKEILQTAHDVVCIPEPSDEDVEKASEAVDVIVEH